MFLDYLLTIIYFMFIFLFIPYVSFGLIYSFIHTRDMLSKIKIVKDEEKRLTTLVAMYELTPQGAEYYTELQNLHIYDKLFLDEAERFDKTPKRYIARVYLIGVFLWPVYLYMINANKKKKQDD